MSTTPDPAASTGRQPRAFYFGGGDPAPAATPSADDGAISIIRATERRPRDPEERFFSPSDYHLHWIFAKTVRNARIAEWSGIIHDLDSRFSIANFVLDPQAGGGGGFLVKELGLANQRIRGTAMQVRPIVTRTTDASAYGRPILTLMKRSDPGVSLMWPALVGDDNMTDAMHQEFSLAWANGWITYPPEARDWPAQDLARWEPERLEACGAIHKGLQQLQSISVASDVNGVIQTTRNGARIYQFSGRKDIAYSVLYAYMAFLVWLKYIELGVEGEVESGEICFSSSSQMHHNPLAM